MFATSLLFSFFFFNDTATTEIYTLSLHDALPISHHFAYQLGVTIQQHSSAFITKVAEKAAAKITKKTASKFVLGFVPFVGALRSEEHTSELQSQSNLVCRLLLEKKKNLIIRQHFE